MPEMITGQETLSPRLIAVQPLPDYQLALTFANGEKKRFDARPLLSVPAYRRLKEKGFFESVSVAHGTLQWPCDIDYCPDCLYANSSSLKNDLTDEERAIIARGREEYKTRSYTLLEDL